MKGVMATQQSIGDRPLLPINMKILNIVIYIQKIAKLYKTYIQQIHDKK